MAATLPFPEQPDILLEAITSPGYRDKVVFFAPHENEYVVNDYLSRKILHLRGRFLILRQRGERNIALSIGQREIAVDPNRIFTRSGARKSLRRLNPDLDEESDLFREAWKKAVRLGGFILEQMGTVGGHTVIIAVHNNTDGYDGDGKGGEGTVSIKRYQKKLDQGAGYIKCIHRGKGDEDDLFFINKPKDFKAMKKAGWNVVLQHPRVARLEEEDDGSLSVYAEMIGARYINIEAQRKKGYDHLEVQKKMVDYVFDLVFD